MKTQLSGGLALRPSSGQSPTKYYGRAKDARPSTHIASGGWVILLVLEVFFTASIATAQPNLVPNSSFEEHLQCPNGDGFEGNVATWKKVQGSPDYYHECGNHEWGIPISWGGGGYARTGQAYIGLGIKHLSEFLPEFREYVGVSLVSALKPSARYRVVFYVSFADSVWYAGKNIGVYFSGSQPTGGLDYMLTLEAQVNYNGEEFLTSKEGWTRIEGTYLALGGENFLTIGNFDDNEETETVFVDGGAEIIKPWSPDAWKVAYYFIDDISVIDVDSLVGVDEMEGLAMNVYPNPAKNFFTIETGQGNGTLSLYDGAGRQVLSILLQSSEQNISVGGIPAGVYVAVVEQKGKAAARRKLVIE